jgi:hypothetical protein
MQNAADAGARAGVLVLANTSGDQAAATAEAVKFSNLNLASYSTITGGTSSVTFPTPETVRVTVSHNVPLFLMPVVGINNGAVSATAVAGYEVISTVPGGSLVPLAIVCNTPGVGPAADNCYNQLQLPSDYTEQRYCGNYFRDGPDGNTCGNPPPEDTKFVMGLDFMGDGGINALPKEMGTNTFRDYFENGYPYKVGWGDVAMSLPGNRNGWQKGLEARLADADRLELAGYIDAAQARRTVIMPVVKAHEVPNHDYNMQIHGFVSVVIKGWGKSGKTDSITYEVVRTFTEGEFAAYSDDGIGTKSVVGVRMTE